MGRFDISPELAEEFRGEFRDSVQPLEDGQALAGRTFRTTRSGTRYAISKTHAGAPAYGATARAGSKRAGGLPGQLLLAVTHGTLNACKYKLERRAVAVKDELAVWHRTGLDVSTARLQTSTRVRLEWPPDGDRIVCDQDAIGDSSWADDGPRALQEHASG